MSQPGNSSSADRNLLFGILAVQINFIDRDSLVAAMNAWVLDKQKPLGQILLEQQKLTAEQLGAIDGLIAQHLKLHGNDPEQSLRAIRAGSGAPTDLMVIADEDLQASMAKFGSGTVANDTISFRPPPKEAARYQKLRPHAGGGLGDVFVANDTELHREVALKEIKPKLADDSANRCRLILEAEITGGLEHPGIVPVYGLGTYPNGRPYYAMRFIRGDNLDVAIKKFHGDERPGRLAGERSLAFRQLLRRFVDICNAVAYAHSRGVVHRDLKPKNVMLGKFGETLVVDWGLAKVGAKDSSANGESKDPSAERTLRPASGSSVEQTMDGVQIGTPAFMSPEQADGRILELGPASDIYSLGSMLFAVLTGKLPFEAPQKEEVLEKVRSGEFSPPRQVKPDTPPALDAICRKAMSMKPTDRYPNALALSADVEHWLADEPVAAYPEPWTARAGRWGRRNKTAVISAGVFLLCATIGLAISTALISAEQRRTAVQKKKAEDNYELAQKQTGIAVLQRQAAIDNYKLSREQSFNIIDLIEKSEAEIAERPNLHKTRSDILILVANACRRYLEQEPDDPELRRRGAQVYRYAANVYRLTDEIEGADPLYRDAIKLYEGLAKQFPEETQYEQMLAETLRDQSKLQANIGRLKEATETLSRSLQLIEELAADHPDQIPLRRTRAATLYALSSVQYARGMYDESSTTAKRAAEMYREFVALADGKGPYDPVLLAGVLNIVAICERESGRLDAAYEAHKEPVGLLVAIAQKPRAGVNHNDVLHFYSSCQLEQSRTWAKYATPKRLENSEKLLDATIATWTAVSRNFPHLPMYGDSLGFAYQCRGIVRSANSARLAEAVVDLEESRKLLEQRVKDWPNIPSPRGDLGRTYLALGRLARQSKDPSADLWLRKATETLEKTVAQSPDSAQDKISLAEARAETSK
jgi:serine/threonine protein kinase/tetratricopeptide (TPR) repeat protein